MNVINNGIKILNGLDDKVFIAVQIASKQSGYSDQYLRKLLRNETIQGIKIGQLWLIMYKSLLGYIEVASTTEDLRYGPRVKNKMKEKRTD
jgi:hypothetical protein